MTMKIIAFTGMPWSGKSEAVTLAKNLNIPVVRMGDMVWDETKRQGLQISDEQVGQVANQMRETHGKDIWAKRTLEKLNTIPYNSVVIIDGIRSIEEVETFKHMLSNDFILVAIDASEKIRHKRALIRKRLDDSTTIENIKQRDKRERAWGLDAVIASADIIISNEKEKDEFHSQVQELLRRVLQR